MTTRIHIGTGDEFEEGQLKKVSAGEISILVTRYNGKVCAVRNQCPHWNIPMDNGKVRNGTVICPLHNSVFDMCSGKNLDWTPGFAGIKVPQWTRRLIAMGKEPQGIDAYTVIEEGNDVYVEI